MKCVALVVLMALVAANAQVIVPSAAPIAPVLPGVLPSVYNYGIPSVYRSLGAWGAAPYSYYGARLAYDPLIAGIPAVYPPFVPDLSTPTVVNSDGKILAKELPGMTIVNSDVYETPKEK